MNCCTQSWGFDPSPYSASSHEFSLSRRSGGTRTILRKDRWLSLLWLIWRVSLVPGLILCSSLLVLMWFHVQECFSCLSPPGSTSPSWSLAFNWMGGRLDASSWPLGPLALGPIRGEYQSGSAWPSWSLGPGLHFISWCRLNFKSVRPGRRMCWWGGQGQIGLSLFVLTGADLSVDSSSDKVLTSLLDMGLKDISGLWNVGLLKLGEVR